MDQKFTPIKKIEKYATFIQKMKDKALFEKSENIIKTAPK